MQLISTNAINIAPSRQRRAFDLNAMQELINSISDTGLLHPIVVRSEGSTNSLYLVAGERRLRAIQEIYELQSQFKCNNQLVPFGMIPYIELGELSPLEAEEAELEENLRRQDLSWQELAMAHKRLHQLRSSQALERGESHLIADTSLEISGRSDGAYQDKTRKEIIIAAHLDNPEVQGAKNVNDAFKILKKQETLSQNLALAKQVGSTYNSNCHTLLNVDCLTWLQDTETRFDTILTDPPYGIGADKFNDGGDNIQTIAHNYDDSYETWQAMLKLLCSLLFQVAKPQAHCYMFCDVDRFGELKLEMQLAGWYVFRTPLVVVKNNSGRVPLPDRGPRRQYELVLYAIKGGKPVTHIYSDVIIANTDSQLCHGAQKPVSVYKNLLQRSVKPGDLVLDCFAGSGPIFPAAAHFNCIATGLELSMEYYSIALQRLQGLEQELELDL